MVTVDRMGLVTALRALSKLTGKGAAWHVLLSAQGDMLSLAAADLKTWLTYKLACKNDSCKVESESACAPVKTLLKAIGGLKNKRGEVLLDIQPSDADGATSTTTVSYASMTVQLVGEKPESFPVNNINTDDWRFVGEVDTELFQDGLKWASGAMSSDSSREHLNTVYVDTDGSIVATDGSRMHVAPSPFLSDIEPPMLLPKSAAVALAHMPSTAGVTMHRCSNRLRVRQRVDPSISWELVTRLIDSSYPSYKDILGRCNAPSCDIRLQAKDLHDTVKHFMQATDETVLEMSISDNTLKLTTSLAGSDNVIVVPTAETHPTGSSTSLYVNGTYLVQASRGITGRLTLSIAGDLDPIMVAAPSGRTAIIMPIRA